MSGLTGCFRCCLLSFFFLRLLSPDPEFPILAVPRSGCIKGTLIVFAVKDNQVHVVDHITHEKNL